MTTAKPNPTKVATKWALINLLAGIVLTYAFQYLVPDSNSPIRYLTLIPFIAFLFLTQKEFRDQNEGYLTFGEGFSAGFRFAIFAGLLSAVFIYIYLAILSPDVMVKAAEQARAQLEAKGGMSSDQIDNAVSLTKKLGPLFGAFGAAIFDAVIGLVAALVGASILKNIKPLDLNEPADPAV